MKEIPRLTRSLRAFSDVCDVYRSDVPPNDLLRKRKEFAEQINRGPNWFEFCNRLPKNLSQELNKLHDKISTAIGGQSAEVVDDIAIYILRILVKEDVVSQNNKAILRQLLGDISSEFIGNAMKLVETVKEKISEDDLRFLLSAANENENVPEANLFGSKIPFKETKLYWPETDMLHDMMLKNDSDFHKFSMAFEKSPEQPEKTVFSKAQLVRGLKQCFEKYSSEMSYEEFIRLIMCKLKLQESIVESELFDLLGYENIEFITYIIEHKKSIFAISNAIKANKVFEKTPQQPQIACQVTVQSAKEKKLIKQVRKEEKKLQKVVSKSDGLSSVDISGKDLLHKKQEAFSAMCAPLFPDLRKIVYSASSQEKFPFVFDSKLAAKSAAGFISGVKIMLPENVVRKDSALCEEVYIPIPATEPLNVGNEPILVSSLDKVGQMAFQGIEKLNRIQSIVFDAAYHTNENLLICAPTGAGKTNIAMLAVVHQLKLHMEMGVLKKNEFKIIYIAPMKALAAEMTASFNKRLGSLGVSVRELTGDMQLTKGEIQQTQMIVTTPEKWDVVTRKGTGDIALTSIVRLLIIDEVHLLHGDRGPVVEALVARTLRQVESSQSMIRIVGLSATLPNYIDVGRFLRVNPYKGLFYFDHRFRPVPLSQTFIGVKALKSMQQMSDMDTVCYNQVVDMVRKGHQVMVFVHARNATIRTAIAIKEMAMQNETLKLFECGGKMSQKVACKVFQKSHNKHLNDLFSSGISVHHAGMLRTDRNVVEKCFSDGLIKVLVCTSTLAWGVNLPAHAVIIRGTEIYDAKRGSFMDLGILDVLQIFGRAGRPQFDTSGHAVIITAHNKLSHYLSLLTNQFPIESSFITYLADNLNAEIALGTISNVTEAVEWLSYTYLFVRMRLNHTAYGILHQTIMDDVNLETKRKELIVSAAMALDKARMIRYNSSTGDLSSTDLGRTSSHYYLKYDTIEIFNEIMRPIMTEADILGMISRSQEFEQLKVRNEEMEELDDLRTSFCEVIPQGGSENVHGKVNILIQTYLSRGRINSFSLLSDQAYITQNAVRICRALFEIMLRKNNAIMASRLLGMAKMLELQQWDHMSPLRQFYCLSAEIVMKIEDRYLSVYRLREMSVEDIGQILHNQKIAALVKKSCDEFPCVELDATLQPITRTIIRIRIQIYPQFQWNDKIHGKNSEAFWMWIEDPDTNFIYHYEYFQLTKKMVYNNLEQEVVMTIPLTEPLPSQYIVKVISDRWLGCENMLPLSFKNLILPETHPPHTNLLELQPLPLSTMKDSRIEKLYNFTHFNLIQTQIFHCLYHTDNNVLLGAPTGSGKTIAAEIAMFRVFKKSPDLKVVYIAPMKALVRERMKDWKIRLEQQLGKRVVELTGDVTPDAKSIASSSVIVTTPEKWDGISRSWQTRNYVRQVALIIIDEIHLLGEDRGPVLEVIVSRTNFIASHTHRTLRIVGLSTALANAIDLAEWLGIKKMGLYNFRPSVRPVPLEVHICGFPGKHYCPRMATMNRPTYQAIRQHAPRSPSLVFVSSRRQTRLTALDLIAYLAAEDNPKQWLHMPENEMDSILDNTKDLNLKLTLAFGIGLHHAGLHDRDRRTVEELFVNNKIQVLIATATLAWGVNFPAHLVVVKGTEYYDGKVKRYVDMPITDVLQMMGRAGRPQFDDSGVAVVLVHDVKKSFYKKFLYEPFPVESNLLEVLPDHINAEIVAGTITTKQEFLDYLTWTYFFRRLLKNPKYYNLDALEPEDINTYLSQLVENTLKELIGSRCVYFDEEQQSLIPLSMGKIASFYYLSHKTIHMFEESLMENLTLEQYLRIMCNVHEYDQLPVRHNEDLLNEELAKMCRYKADRLTYDSPNTKAFLLLQAHFSRLPMPCADYLTDLKSILDQSIRILQAMIDVVADRGWLSSTLRIIQILQMIIQARWIDESALTTLPHVENNHLYLFSSTPKCLPAFCATMLNNYTRLSKLLLLELTENEVHQVHEVIKELPTLCVSLEIEGHWNDRDSKEIVKLLPNSKQFIDVHQSSDYNLVIAAKRKNRSHNLKAHSPFFQKGKDEGWFFILGDVKNKELLALKRASGINGPLKLNQLLFKAPNTLGRTKLALYIMSDSYIGLDQQYTINLNVIG